MLDKETLKKRIKEVIFDHIIEVRENYTWANLLDRFPEQVDLEDAILEVLNSSHIDIVFVDDLPEERKRFEINATSMTTFDDTREGSFSACLKQLIV